MSSRIDLQRKQLGLQQQREKSMGRMPSMFGGFDSPKGSAMPSLMNPFGAEPKRRARRKTKRKKRK